MPPVDDCPDALALAGPLTGDLIAHAAGCPACREALADLACLDAAPLSPAARRAALARLEGRRSAWRGWAAAAGLLLAAGVFHGLGTKARSAPAPTPPAGAAVEPPFPPPADASGLAEAAGADLRLVLGRSGALVLRVGSRARLRGEAALLAGSAWLECEGEPFVLRLGRSTVRGDRATLLLEAPPPAPGGLSWLREALAAGGEGRLAVLSGTALLEREGLPPLAVVSGLEVALDGLHPVPLQALAWRGDTGWKVAPGLPRRLGEGQHPLAGDLPPSWLWEARFRRVDASAGAAVCAGGRQVPLGAPLAQDGAIRVQAVLRDGWIRLTAGSYELLNCPLGDLDRMDPAPAACGLRVWGGDLELLESRWRPLE